MGLIYDFYENPPGRGNDKQPRLHARVVPQHTVGTQEMSKLIQSASTLSTGDITAVLSMFREQIISQLKEGNRVHWEGVGYFELTLSCPPIHSPREIRAESIKAKSIVFRPEKSLKKIIKHTPLARARIKRHSKHYSEIEIDDLLASYFQDNQFITSIEFRRICGLTESTAARRLRKLIVDGKLQKTGHHRFPLYEPVKGHYRYNY